MKKHFERASIEAFAGLTSTQRRRVKKRLEGATLSEIANSEGRAISTIDESLKSPKVREAITVLGHEVLLYRRETGEAISLLTMLLDNLRRIALTATRPITVSYQGMQTVEMVPDFRVRLDATTRFLEFIEPSLATSPGRHPEDSKESATVQAVEVRRTVTSSEKLRVSRTGRPQE